MARAAKAVASGAEPVVESSPRTKEKASRVTPPQIARIRQIQDLGERVSAATKARDKAEERRLLVLKDIEEVLATAETPEENAFLKSLIAKPV